MKSIKKHILLPILAALIIPQTLLAAPKGGGGSVSSVFHLEAGLGLMGGTSKFEETDSSDTYENSMINYGLDIFGRAGLRLGPVSLGITAAVDVISANGGKKLDGEDSGDRYEYQSIQLLGGGFLGVSLNGAPSGPTLFGEYYAFADNTANYSDDTTNNPFRRKDKMTGTGWGAGISFNIKQDVRVGLLYRDLKYDKVDLSGTTPTASVTQGEMPMKTGTLFVSKYF